MTFSWLARRLATVLFDNLVSSSPFLNEGDLDELLLVQEGRAESEKSSSVESRALARRSRRLRLFLAFDLVDVATVGATLEIVYASYISGNGTWPEVLLSVERWVVIRRLT